MVSYNIDIKENWNVFTHIFNPHFFSTIGECVQHLWLNPTRYSYLVPTLCLSEHNWINLSLTPPQKWWMMTYLVTICLCTYLCIQIYKCLAGCVKYDHSNCLRITAKKICADILLSHCAMWQILSLSTIFFCCNG